MWDLFEQSQQAQTLILEAERKLWEKACKKKEEDPSENQFMTAYDQIKMSSDHGIASPCVEVQSGENTTTIFLNETLESMARKIEVCMGKSLSEKGIAKLKEALRDHFGEERRELQVEEQKGQKSEQKQILRQILTENKQENAIKQKNQNQNKTMEQQSSIARKVVKKAPKPDNFRQLGKENKGNRYSQIHQRKRILEK